MSRSIDVASSCWSRWGKPIGNQLPRRRQPTRRRSPRTMGTCRLTRRKRCLMISVRARPGGITTGWLPKRPTQTFQLSVRLARTEATTHRLHQRLFPAGPLLAEFADRVTHPAFNARATLPFWTHAQSVCGGYTSRIIGPRSGLPCQRSAASFSGRLPVSMRAIASSASADIGHQYPGASR